VNTSEIRMRNPMGRIRAVTRRTLLRQLLAQQTYPEMLGLNVENKADWFPWLMASSLFARPISATIARATAVLLFENGVTSPKAIERRGWDRLVSLLDRGGYVRYDFSTATKLLALAAALPEDRLQRVVTEASSLDETQEHLTAVKGVGPKTVEIFLRELRGIGQIEMPVSAEARQAAARLGIDVNTLRLPARDLSRLQSILVRIWIEHCKRHRWRTCPAGAACGCAMS
jgi:endonuclease III